MILRILIAAVVVGGVAFISWHLGRWHERDRVRKGEDELRRMMFEADEAEETERLARKIRRDEERREAHRWN